MTVISQAATRKPYAGATALRHSHVRAIMLAALTTCLVLLGQTANAQKSYKYEDDPIRAGNKALEENRLDDAKAKSQLDFGASRRGVGQGEDLYHRGLAIYYIVANDLKAAETEALNALHLNPSDPRHGKLVAAVYEKRNVPQLAINACEDVLRTP